jgi:DNA-binding NtrC family response regulator
VDHVLLVDDDRAELRTLSRVVKKLGARVYPVECVNDAQTLLDSTRIDVVVADHLMPGSTGLDLLAWIAERHPSVVTILLTGDPRRSTVIRAINETQVFRFVGKPWSPAELLTTLAKACDLARLLRTNDPRANVELRPAARPWVAQTVTAEDLTTPVLSEAQVAAQWETLTQAQQHQIHEKVVDLLYDRRLCATLGVPYNDPGTQAYKLYAYAMTQL